jgi:putative DNA primase/helicase
LRDVPLRNIVRALGGELYASGGRANVPYPGHSRADRSLSILYDNGRVVVSCFGAGDWKEALGHLRDLGLIDRDNRPTGSGLPMQGPLPLVVSSREKSATASAIWESGRAIDGTLAETHLRLRHITSDLPGPHVARFSPAVPMSAYRTEDWVATRPALVVAVRDVEGAFSGVEVTYLRPNGRRADELRLPRKHIGRIPAGCAVRIDPVASHMLVAEGFVTALSARNRFVLPGWALLSTRNLRTWSAPPGVRSVLIAGDNGADGRRSAGVLAERLETEGVRACLAFPDEQWGDWNDAAP